MGDTYHYNIPHLVIHIIHIVFGLWLAYIGYKRIIDKPIQEYNYYILIGLGSIVTLYFIHLLYKNLGKSWNYAFGLPNWLVQSIHISNGILLLLVGLKFLKINEIIALYFVVTGSLAGLYHAHLMFVKH